MKLIQRWKQLSLSNKLSIYTGALVALGTLFYAGTAVFQFCLMKGSASETAKQNETMIAEVRRIAGTIEENNDQNKRALDASLNQAKRALDASIENSRLDQRAWVVIKDMKFRQELKADELNPFDVKLVNVGKTPAQHICGKVTYRVHILGQPDSVKTEPFKQLDSLGAGVIYEIRFDTDPSKLNKVAIDNMESGNTVLTVIIDITYQDIFGKSHKSGFCGSYLPGLKLGFDSCPTGTYVE